jgi:hypothetical protein
VRLQSSARDEVQGRLRISEGIALCHLAPQGETANPL